MTANTEGLHERTWVDAELEDSFDEELEMEIDDERTYDKLRGITLERPAPAIERRQYFRELLRL